MSTVELKAVGFKEQELLPSTQCDLKSSLRRVTELPILKLASLPAICATAFTAPNFCATAPTAPNITFTVLLVDQVQAADGAPVKAKRALQGQVAEVIPAESVGVSKVITTSCPLSEN